VVTYLACQWLISLFVVWLSDDYTNSGILALAMSITNFLAIIAAYNIRNFQISDIKGEYNDSEYVITRIITCTVSFLLCMGFVFIVDFSNMQRIIILCYMLFRIGEAFIDVLHGIDQKSWRMDYIGISTIIRGVLMLAAFILLLWLFDLLSAVIGMVIITFLTAFLYDFQKAKKLAKFTAFAGKKILSLLKICFPLMLVLLVITLIVSFARFSMQRMYGDEALGIYVAASNPTLIIQSSAFLLFAPLINLFAEALKESNKKKFLKIFIVVFAAVVAITVIFTTASYVFGEWVLRILFDESITEHAYLLIGASVASGFTALIWLMNIVFTAIRDIKGVFVCNLIGMIICLATSEMLLRSFGLNGANYVMIISQGAAVVFALVRLFWVLNSNKGLLILK